LEDRMAERLSCRAVRDAVEDAQFVLRAAAHYGQAVCDGAAPPTAERHYWKLSLTQAPGVLSRVLRLLERACERRKRRISERRLRLRIAALQLELPLYEG